MARRKRGPSASSEETDQTVTYSPSGGSAGLFPDLERPIGLNNVTNRFVIGDDQAYPKFLIKDCAVEIFGRLDFVSVSPDVTYYRNDPIGKNIIQEFFPILDDFLLRTSGTTYAPTRAAIASYFADVEYAYQLAKTIVALRALYEFNWGAIPPGNTDVPSSLWYLGTSLKLDDYNFELEWGPLFRRLGQHIILPGIRGIVDNVFRPFTMGPNDGTVRVFAADADLLLDIPGFFAGYYALLEGVLDGLDADPYDDVRDWLTKFLNFRVGSITTEVALGNALLSHTWWNGSTVLYDVYRDIASASSNPPTTLICSRALYSLLPSAETVGSTPVWHNTTAKTSAMVHAVGGQISMNTLAYIPFYLEQRYNATNWSATLATAVSTGAIYWLKDGAIDMDAVEQLPINTAALTTAQLESYEYFGSIASRYQMSPGAANDAAWAVYAPLDGMKNLGMPPVQVFSDQVFQLAELWGAYAVDSMMIRALEVGTGASIPRTMNAKVAAIQDNWLTKG